jgi:hypothetical protein
MWWGVAIPNTWSDAGVGIGIFISANSGLERALILDG